jgi:hypothetical protein
MEAPAAQRVPQLALDIGLFAPEPARNSVFHGPSPGAADAAPPSPTRGEGC